MFLDDSGPCKCDLYSTLEYNDGESKEKITEATNRPRYRVRESQRSSLFLIFIKFAERKICG